MLARLVLREGHGLSRGMDVGNVYCVLEMTFDLHDRKKRTGKRGLGCKGFFSLPSCPCS